MGFWRTLAKVGGAAAGFAVGGVGGAAAGYKLGSTGEKPDEPPAAAAPASGDPAGSHLLRRVRAGMPPAPAGPDRSGDQTGIDVARARYESAAGGGQNELNSFATSAINQAMPGLQSTLQGIRESAARRGVSNGEIGIGYEGRAMGDFGQQIANAVGGQAVALRGQQQAGAADLYHSSMASRDSNREFDRAGTNADREYNRALTNDDRDYAAGNADRATAADNARRQQKSSTWGSVLGAAGTLGGAYLASRNKA